MLTQTIRHAFRSWRRTPVLAVTALLTLSLGVGFNAAIFSVVHAVLLRPLPYPAPDRLVEVSELSPAKAGVRVSALNYLAFASRTHSLDALAAFNSASFNLTGEGDAERIAGTAVTASLFRVLAIAPIAGRPLVPDDERPGSRPVALIAQSFWQRRYGGDRSIVGQTITLNGERHEIVGVVSDAFREVGRSQISAVASPQIFVPLTIDPARENRGNHVLRVVGRLRPGMSFAQANEDMSAIAAALGQEFPASNKGWGARVERVQDSMLDEGVRSSLFALLGAVAVVMFIACANVSNLVLAKAIDRQRELALRTALGAEPGRLVRQLFTESLCLAAVSGPIGIAVSVVAVEVLRSALPPTMPRINEVRVDIVVLGFGLLVSLLSGILFGLLPAIRVSRVDPGEVLRLAGRGTVAGSSRAGLRQGLVAAQVALVTTLLVGGVLLLQSFMRLQQVPLGFDPDGVLTARIGLPRPAYVDPPRVAAFYRRLLEAIDMHPNVQSAAVATSAPFGTGARRTVTAGSRTTAAAASSLSVAEHIVSEDYFRTLAVPIVAGRAFDDRDRVGSPPVVVVSQALARQLWPDDNPVGQQFERDGILHDVVGVVRDVRGDDVRGPRGGGLDRQPPPAVYLSATQFPQSTMTVLIRSTGEPSFIAGPLRAAIREIDSTVPADQVRPLGDWLADAAAQPRLTTTLAGMFAGMALLLAAIGIYGVAAHAVGLRRQELGVRMALGATRWRILTLILRGGIISAAAGMAIGFAGAFFVNKVLASLLFDVRPEDPLAFVSVAALLAMVALIAGYLPARRATHIPITTVLQSE